MNQILVVIAVGVRDCTIPVAAVCDRRLFVSRRISAVADRRYSAKANFKWYNPFQSAAGFKRAIEKVI